LLDPQVSRAGNVADFFQQAIGKVAVSFHVSTNDLNVDRSWQS